MYFPAGEFSVKAAAVVGPQQEVLGRFRTSRISIIAGMKGQEPELICYSDGSLGTELFRCSDQPNEREVSFLGLRMTLISHNRSFNVTEPSNGALIGNIRKTKDHFMRSDWVISRGKNEEMTVTLETSMFTLRRWKSRWTIRTGAKALGYMQESWGQKLTCYVATESDLDKRLLCALMYHQLQGSYNTGA